VLAAIEGYLDMVPRAGSSSVTSDPATRSLASRLEVVRSFVQDSESGDENSDESSVGSLGGSDEHLPKERAYSVGCKPPMMSAQLHLHAGYGSTRPPKGPGKTVEKSTESKQRHLDSPGSAGGARLRKISVTSRPEHFQKLSSEAGSSKSLAAEGVVATKPTSEPDRDKSDRGAVEGTIRPRTLTMPWDLLRGTRNTTDDLLRPRSSSGGNAASIREAVQARLAAAGRHATSLSGSSTCPSSYTDPARHLTQRRELVCSSDSQEVGEYVEMHCPAAS